MFNMLFHFILRIIIIFDIYRLVKSITGFVIEQK